MSDKAGERTKLILALGRLLAPLHRLAEGDPRPTIEEFRIAAARFRGDFNQFKPLAQAYARVGNVEFTAQSYGVLGALKNVSTGVLDAGQHPDAEARPHQMRKLIDNAEAAAVAAIDAIPIDWVARIASEQTPFTCHLHIHDVVRTATKASAFL